MQALDMLGKGPLEIGKLPPTEGLVDQYFNDSTGKGPEGETDMSDKWAPKHGFETVDNPAFNPEQMKLGKNGHARRH
jgi:Mn-containing catalase